MFNRESPAQFENGIQPLVCIRPLRVVLCEKKLILLAGTGVSKVSSVACVFSPIKIHLSDYLKSLISRINEVIVFFNKISL